jgi:hypothetical protein
MKLGRTLIGPSSSLVIDNVKIIIYPVGVFANGVGRGLAARRNEDFINESRVVDHIASVWIIWQRRLTR